MEKTNIPFDGVFRFTNWTDDDFHCKWDNIPYVFPARKTSPIIIPNASPEQVQNIRKKFARELAEREWYKSDKLKSLEAATPKGSVSSFRQANIYAESELDPYVEKCLEPLEIAQAIAGQKETNNVPVSEGTRIISEKEQLIPPGATVA